MPKILLLLLDILKHFPSGSAVKNLTARQEMWAWSPSWEDSLLRKWQPAPVFLPKRAPGQRSLAGCSQQGLEESDATGSTDGWRSVTRLLFIPMLVAGCKGRVVWKAFKLFVLAWISMISFYKVQHAQSLQNLLYCKKDINFINKMLCIQI